MKTQQQPKIVQEHIKSVNKRLEKCRFENKKMKNKELLAFCEVFATVIKDILKNIEDHKVRIERKEGNLLKRDGEYLRVDLDMSLFDYDTATILLGAVEFFTPKNYNTNALRQNIKFHNTLSDGFKNSFNRFDDEQDNTKITIMNHDFGHKNLKDDKNAQKPHFNLYALMGEDTNKKQDTFKIKTVKMHLFNI